MPGPGEAVSAKQRTAMAIAEHDPDKLYDRNKSMLKMNQTQLHNFAATKGLGSPKGSNPRQLSRPGNSKASSGLLSSNRKVQGIAKT